MVKTGTTAASLASDIEIIQGLSEPTTEGMIDAARLLIRYPHYPEIEQVILSKIDSWGLDRATLNTKVREIWSSGYRPGQQTQAQGSGYDTTQED